MKFKINAKVSLSPTIDGQHLLQILEPENKTPDKTTIQTKIQNDQVVTTIKGEMKIGTLIRSLDDILATATLTETVAESTQNSS